jgi:hypothetical protein
MHRYFVNETIVKEMILSDEPAYTVQTLFIIWGDG